MLGPPPGINDTLNSLLRFSMDNTNVIICKARIEMYELLLQDDTEYTLGRLNH